VVYCMTEKSQNIRVNLSKWQQKMLKDLFGVKTDTMDFVKELHDIMKYRTLIPEKVSNLHIQRMYLEDDQKVQIANIMGMKPEEMCDFIELDHETIVKYMALHNFLYGAPRKAD